jgi:putative membrane protein
MVSAFAASAVFLIGYVIYHYAHGDTQYQGEGAVRIVYFTVLITHVLLSIVMLPMILTTFYLAARERFTAHRKLAKWTLPIWLYVSVTGVVIYFMLR